LLDFWNFEPIPESRQLDQSPTIRGQLPARQGADQDRCGSGLASEIECLSFLEFQFETNELDLVA
jgi:hypothetical protein